MAQRTTRRRFLEGGKTLALGCLSTCGIPGTLPTASAGRAGEERFVEPVLPNRYERQAVARGQALGIGSAVLEGPTTVEVGSHQTWTLVYTAGKVGLRAGGGLRLAMRHLAHQWWTPQVNRPRERNCLTVEAERGQPVELTIDFGIGRRFFTQYFPWQNIVEVLLPERGLEAGQRATTLCCPASAARELGRSLKWDPVKEPFIGDAEASANRWPRHSRRQGYERPVI